MVHSPWFKYFTRGGRRNGIGGQGRAKTTKIGGIHSSTRLCNMQLTTYDVNNHPNPKSHGCGALVFIINASLHGAVICLPGIFHHMAKDFSILHLFKVFLLTKKYTEFLLSVGFTPHRSGL
ncbi:hypothetical protein NQD34_014547 [Periophthalmus magnuspinnatus]|nr:hypothetical protein NQD34_014547 [Periophthalmus magnuspinnatus]